MARMESSSQLTGTAGPSHYRPAPEKRARTGGSPAEKPMRWPWIVLGIIALFAGIYVGLAWYQSGRIAQGTTVEGVKIGGMTAEEANQTLTSAFDERLSRDVNYVVDSDTFTANPSSYELAVDVNGTLDGITKFTLNPKSMFAGLFGSAKVEPRYTFNEQKLAEVTEQLLSETGTAPVNAGLTFEGSAPVLSPAQSGSAVSTDAARQALINTPLRGEERAELVAERKDPAINDAAAKRANDELATPLVSGDLRVRVGEAETSLPPAVLARAARFTPAEGALQLEMDPQVLGDAVRERLPEIIKPGVDARIEITDHTTPTIIPSEDGQGIDDADLAAKATQAGVKTVASERQVEAKVAPMPAQFTTADAQAMGIKEVVSEISTPLTNDSVRTKNLVVGNGKVSNTLIKPGERFSLLDTLGPITAENGFVSSGVVANGFNDTAMGGGLSQLSTNTFNIGYLAGMEDIEHKPHSKYFERYPMGREATLWEGSVDMVWANRSPYGVMIDSYIENGKVVTKLWSTKHFTVETSTSAPRGYTQPTMVEDSGADCKPQGRGGPGFTVTVTRTVTDPSGTVVEDSSYNWTYQPVNGRTCS